MKKDIDKQLQPMFNRFAEMGNSTGVHWSMSGAALSREFLSPAIKDLVRQAYLQGVYDALIHNLIADEEPAEATGRGE